LPQAITRRLPKPNYKALPNNLKIKLFNAPKKPTFAKLLFEQVVKKKDSK
jgi:hypothetical protein